MKNEMIEKYIIMTLNEIKQGLPYSLKLNQEKIQETDKKMAKILSDLIDSRFNNINVDKDLNLVYTFLPLNDKRENQKIRRLFELYYAALYYDNVDLLSEMLKNDICFYKPLSRFELLDKDLSSRYDKDEYIKITKEKDDILFAFICSINTLETEEKNKYIDRFINILNLRYDDLEDNYNYSYVLTKKALDIFTDEAYLNSSKEQLAFISDIGRGSKIDEQYTNRLNNLIINSDYCKNLCNMNLMLKIFTDEELNELSYSDSQIISHYYGNEETLNKAIDLVKKYKHLLAYELCLTKEIFMKIDNDVLYEMVMKYRLGEMSDEAILFAAKLCAPKAKVKSFVRRKIK